MTERALFLPGWAVPVAWYREAAPALWREAIYLDPGFFTGSDRGFAAAEYAAKVAAELHSETVIYAHSMGSMFALRAAAESERVKALILFSPFARFAEAPGYAGQPERQIKAMQLQLRRDPVGLLNQFIAAAYRPEPPPAVDWRTHTPAVKALRDGLQVLMEEDVRELLPRVRCPVLILQGGVDAISGDGQADYLAAALPQARTMMIPGRGHALPLTSGATCEVTAAAFIRVKTVQE